MGDNLTALDAYREARKHEIDPQIFGIARKSEEKGNRRYYVFAPTLFNAYMLLSKHEYWVGKIKYCQFENIVHIEGKAIAPDLVLDVIIWIAGTYQVNYKKGIIDDALYKIAKENQYHSLLEKLTNGAFGPTKWDGMPRIDDFLYKYMGVRVQIHNADDFEGKTVEQQKLMDKENNNRIMLIRAYSRKFFLSLMARLLWARVGSDIDVHTILVMYGAQGIGKGFCIKTLCMQDQYFSNTSLDMRHKDAPLKLRGKMIYELAELAKRSKDIELEKAFISDAKDTTVLKYDKYSTEMPRQCIFVATTNKLNILRDSTGSRRWWPVIVGETFADGEKIDIDAIKNIAPQLWFEAYNILTKQEIEHDGKKYTAKEAIAKKIPGYEKFIWWLTPEEDKERERDREVYISVHPWRRPIENWIYDINNSKDPLFTRNHIKYKIDKKDNKKTSSRYFVIQDFEPIYTVLGIDPSKRRHTDREQIVCELTALGFFRKRWRFGEGDNLERVLSYARQIHKPEK